MREWCIYKEETNEFDTATILHDIVFFDDNMMAPEVYKRLTEHDNYPSNVILTWTHENEYGDLIQCDYPSEDYQTGYEYNKKFIVVNDNIPDDIIMPYLV